MRFLQGCDSEKESDNLAVGSGETVLKTLGFMNVIFFNVADSENSSYISLKRSKTKFIFSAANVKTRF